MSESILAPEILDAAIQPNPAGINTRIKLSIAVTERTITLEPEARYSGELYAGEV